MDNVQKQILSLIKAQNPVNPLQYAHTIVQEYSREKLDNYIRNCKECGLDCPRSITKGKANASVLIVGEAVSEDQIGQGDVVYPFENESGEILNKVLESLNVNQEELFYINAVNCWPHKTLGNEDITRTAQKQEVKGCSIFVNHAIEIVQPLMIILLGSIAMNLYKKDSISNGRGEWLDVKGIPAMPTYHPGYFMKIEGKMVEEKLDEKKWEFFSDIQKAFLYLQETYPDNNVLLSPIE